MTSLGLRCRGHRKVFLLPIFHRTIHITNRLNVVTNHAYGQLVAHAKLVDDIRNALLVNGRCGGRFVDEQDTGAKTSARANAAHFDWPRKVGWEFSINIEKPEPSMQCLTFMRMSFPKGRMIPQRQGYIVKILKLWIRACFWNTKPIRCLALMSCS